MSKEFLMKGNKLLAFFALVLIGTLSSCLDALKKSESSPIVVGTPKAQETPTFLPTDLKYISISATQDNGEGFVISTMLDKNKGLPTVEDGRIDFNLDYETFSGKKQDLSIKTDIFSLVRNGFVKQTFNTEDFSLMMEPGIYILTVTISKGKFPYPPFKAKMVVKCSSTLAGNIFNLDPSKVQITPIADVFWTEQNRSVYFGRYQHSLMNGPNNEVVLPPSGANLSLYTFNLDTNGDGTLEVINGQKLSQTSFGIDIINRALYSKPVTYSTFADNKRFVTYEVYDECFNSKAFEVSTGDNGVFGITEKEDLTNSSTIPQMSLEQNLQVDPSYMVQHKMSFLQQMQQESASCNNRAVGGVNYPQVCDTRLNGTLSLIPVMNRVAVTCLKSNGSSIAIAAKELPPALNDGLNYNVVGEYGVNLTINGITTKYTEVNGEPFIELDPTNARLDNYTFSIPGTGDAVGKDVLTTNNCTVKVLLPILSKIHTPCGGNTTGKNGFRQTIQNVRVAYQCGNAKSILGKNIEVAGELYCNTGITSTETDCVQPPPEGTPIPGYTPVPTVNPPNTPIPQ